MHIRSGAIRNTNDGSGGEPCLRVDLNIGSLFALPAHASGPSGGAGDLYAALKAAGYAGVQHPNPREVLEHGLRATGMGRVDKPEEAEVLAAKHKAMGLDATTLHVGNGFESDEEMDRLAEAVLAASVTHDYPLYIETHRATITQDMRRTLDLVERWPGIRFNGDFSHWYTGQELTYGDLAWKLERLAPVFERTRFLHGRIGTPGSIQIDIENPPQTECIDHFRDIWTRAFAGFLRTAKPGDYIVFCPELLPAFAPLPGGGRRAFNYAPSARGADGEWIESGDRWTQALACTELARGCFNAARSRIAAAETPI
ncbi:MAG TPA: hypothetical protein VGN05_01260 [Parvibaculum sp.]|jgi:hypothetical protein